MPMSIRREWLRRRASATTGAGGICFLSEKYKMGNKKCSFLSRNMEFNINFVHQRIGYFYVMQVHRNRRGWTASVQQGQQDRYTIIHPFFLGTVVIRKKTSGEGYGMMRSWKFE